jgi:hypothetical protein
MECGLWTALVLDADPPWAGVINTVLVKKGVRVRELRLATVPSWEKRMLHREDDQEVFRRQTTVRNPYLDKRFQER